MYIRRLQLKQFRNYEGLDVTFDPGINLFFGQNGSGKTNLLEAIHYCALGKSHRTSQDREVIRRDRLSAACGVTLEKRDGTHDVAVKLIHDGTKRKQVFVDGKKAQRMSDMMGLLQCVIFSPEDLMLVKEGPAVRRRFLDMLLSQLSTAYFTALQSYAQALLQRNALLRENLRRRGHGDLSTLALWDEAMARAAAVIIPQRENICSQIAREAARRYTSISGREEEIFGIRYLSCLSSTEQVEAEMLAELEKRREEDIRRGSTSFGPHREDIELTIKGKEMKLFASQGQMRTAALALKLSELTVFQQMAGEYPVLLLDDVMSELDISRRKRLLDEIRGIQTFITCTDESDIGSQEKYTPWFVSSDENGGARVTGVAREERTERIKELDDSFLD